MRKTVCLLLAALLATAAAVPAAKPKGVYIDSPGCETGKDTIKRFRIKGATFDDIVPGQFVRMAFIQAKSRMRAQAERDSPYLHTDCSFDGIVPLHGCYNSYDPGKLGPKQVAGQYGFEATVKYVCPDTSAVGGYKSMEVECWSRMNTLRNNRVLSLQVWVGPDGKSFKYFKCLDPVEVA